MAYSSRVAGVFYGGAAAEAAAITPEGTEFSTATQLSLYVADGLLEVLEWAAQGQAADAPAAIWLALLRWYNNRYGAFPEGLPAAPNRWIDEFSMAPGDVDEATRAGLQEVEMGIERKPHGAEATGPDALVRAAPIGMLPQLDAEWVTKVSRQATVLTHADWLPAAAYARLIHQLVTDQTLLAGIASVLEWMKPLDAEFADQLHAALTTPVRQPSTAREVLAAAIGIVSDTQHAAVAPEQFFATAVTSAVNAGGDTRATAYVSGQLVGALFGNPATGTPSYLDQYRVLEEAVDRWVGLTQ